MALEPIDAGVWCWLGTPARAGVANAGIVVDADGITVVDTLMTPRQWEPFAAAVAELGPPVRRVVLTSSSIEHAGGTRAFPAAAIFASPQASIHLDQAGDTRTWRALYPDEADGFDELSTRPVTHVVSHDAALTPAVTLIATGGAQAENVVAVVPGASVCFAGAMASSGVTPCCPQGDPKAWADALDRLAGLAAIVVPGHGPPGGAEELADLAGYLRACVQAEGDPGAVAPGPWDRWVDRHFDAVNVERAALLAEGRDEIPPAMLRLAEGRGSPGHPGP